MSYNEYLFCCLLKLYSKEFNELEYDLQYQLGIEKYNDFSNSQYNCDSKSEYDCIVKYLKDKYYDLNANRNISIFDLNISVRLYNIFKSAGIYTLGDLEKKEISELLILRNFGKFCLNECEKLLETYNLKSLYKNERNIR